MSHSSDKTCKGNALWACDSAIIKQTSCRVSWLGNIDSKAFSWTKVKLIQAFNGQGSLIAAIYNLIWRLRLITEPEGWRFKSLTSSKKRLTHPCILRCISNRDHLALWYISHLLICNSRKNLLFLRDVIIIQIIVNWLADIRPIIVYSLWLHFLGVTRRDRLVEWHDWEYVTWLLQGLSLVLKALAFLVVLVVLKHYNLLLYPIS